MRIRTIRNIQENYEIRLPAGRKKRLNFVIAEPGLYSELFEELLWYFGNDRDGKIEVDLDGEKRYDPKFMFIEEHHHDYYDLLDYFADMKYMEDFAKISERANQMFGKILSEHKNKGYTEFLKIKDRHIMVPPSLPAAEASIAYYSLLAAIRERYRMDTPLVVEGIGRYGLKYAPLLVQLMAEVAPQVLILVTEANFTTPMYNYRTRKPTMSVYDTVRRSLMGSAFRLEESGVSKYKPRL